MISTTNLSVEPDQAHTRNGVTSLCWLFSYRVCAENVILAVELDSHSGRSWSDEGGANLSQII